MSGKSSCEEYAIKEKQKRKAARLKRAKKLGIVSSTKRSNAALPAPMLFQNTLNPQVIGAPQPTFVQRQLQAMQTQSQLPYQLRAAPYLEAGMQNLINQTMYAQQNALFNGMFGRSVRGRKQTDQPVDKQTMTTPLSAVQSAIQTTPLSAVQSAIQTTLKRPRSRPIEETEESTNKRSNIIVRPRALNFTSMTKDQIDNLDLNELMVALADKAIPARYINYSNLRRKQLNDKNFNVVNDKGEHFLQTNTTEQNVKFFKESDSQGRRNVDSKTGSIYLDIDGHKLFEDGSFKLNTPKFELGKRSPNNKQRRYERERDDDKQFIKQLMNSSFGSFSSTGTPLPNNKQRRDERERDDDKQFIKQLMNSSFGSFSSTGTPLPNNKQRGPTVTPGTPANKSNPSPGIELQPVKSASSSRPQDVASRNDDSKQTINDAKNNIINSKNPEVTPIELQNESERDRFFNAMTMTTPNNKRNRPKEQVEITPGPYDNKVLVRQLTNNSSVDSFPPTETPSNLNSYSSTPNVQTAANQIKSIRASQPQVDQTTIELQKLPVGKAPGVYFSPSGIQHSQSWVPSTPALPSANYNIFNAGSTPYDPPYVSQFSPAWVPPPSFSSPLAAPSPFPKFQYPSSNQRISDSINIENPLRITPQYTPPSAFNLFSPVASAWSNFFSNYFSDRNAQSFLKNGQS